MFCVCPVLGQWSVIFTMASLVVLVNADKDQSTRPPSTKDPSSPPCVLPIPNCSFNSCETICFMDPTNSDEFTKPACYCDLICALYGDCCYDFYTNCLATTPNIPTLTLLSDLIRRVPSYKAVLDFHQAGLLVDVSQCVDIAVKCKYESMHMVRGCHSDVDVAENFRALHASLNTPRGGGAGWQILAGLSMAEMTSRCLADHHTDAHTVEHTEQSKDNSTGRPKENTTEHTAELFTKQITKHPWPEKTTTARPSEHQTNHKTDHFSSGQGSSLLDLWPVSLQEDTGLNTTVQFKNVFCAICNGISPDSLMFWNSSPEPVGNSSNLTQYENFTMHEAMADSHMTYRVKHESIGSTYFRSCFRPHGNREEEVMSPKTTSGDQVDLSKGLSPTVAPDTQTHAQTTRPYSWTSASVTEAEVLCGRYQAVSFELTTSHDWYKNPHCFKHRLLTSHDQATRSVGDPCYNDTCPLTCPFNLTNLALLNDFHRNLIFELFPDLNPVGESEHACEQSLQPVPNCNPGEKNVRDDPLNKFRPPIISVHLVPAFVQWKQSWVQMLEITRINTSCPPDSVFLPLKGQGQCQRVQCQDGYVFANGTCQRSRLCKDVNSDLSASLTSGSQSQANHTTTNTTNGNNTCTSWSESDDVKPALLRTPRKFVIRAVFTYILSDLDTIENDQDMGKDRATPASETSATSTTSPSRVTLTDTTPASVKSHEKNETSEVTPGRYSGKDKTEPQEEGILKNKTSHDKNETLEDKLSICNDSKQEKNKTTQENNETTKGEACRPSNEHNINRTEPEKNEASECKLNLNNNSSENTTNTSCPMPTLQEFVDLWLIDKRRSHTKQQLETWTRSTRELWKALRDYLQNIVTSSCIADMSVNVFDTKSDVDNTTEQYTKPENGTERPTKNTTEQTSTTNSYTTENGDKETNSYYISTTDPNTVETDTEMNNTEKTTQPTTNYTQVVKTDDNEKEQSSMNPKTNTKVENTTYQSNNKAEQNSTNTKSDEEKNAENANFENTNDKKEQNDSDTRTSIEANLESTKNTSSPDKTEHTSIKTETSVEANFNSTTKTSSIKETEHNLMKARTNEGTSFQITTHPDITSESASDQINEDVPSQSTVNPKEATTLFSPELYNVTGNESESNDKTHKENTGNKQKGLLDLLNNFTPSPLANSNNEEEDNDDEKNDDDCTAIVTHNNICFVESSSKEVSSVQERQLSLEFTLFIDQTVTASKLSPLIDYVLSTSFVHSVTSRGHEHNFLLDSLSVGSVAVPQDSFCSEESDLQSEVDLVDEMSFSNQGTRIVFLQDESHAIETLAVSLDFDLSDVYKVQFQSVVVSVCEPSLVCPEGYVESPSSYWREVGDVLVFGNTTLDLGHEDLHLDLLTCVNNTHGVLQHAQSVDGQRVRASCARGDMYYIQNNTVRVCSSVFGTEHGTKHTTITLVETGEFEHSVLVIVVTYVCTSVSVLCLLIVLAVYVALPELRNVTGRVVMSLSVSLITAQLLILFSLLPTEHTVVCYVYGVFMHAAWLACVAWLAILSLDLAHSLASVTTPTSGTDRSRVYLTYCLVGWLLPLTLVLTSVTLDVLDIVQVKYGHTPGCWMDSTQAVTLFMTLPMGCSELVCCVCLFIIVRAICRSRRFRQASRAPSQHARSSMWMCVTLALTMGSDTVLQWSSNAMDDSEELLLVQYALTSLKGLYILLCFVARRALCVKLLAKWKAWAKARDQLSGRSDLTTLDTVS